MEISSVRHSRLMTWFILLMAIGIIGLWIAFTPSGIRGKGDAVGYAICHRIAERSFFAFDKPLSLCARCTGIYLGAMTGLGMFIASGRSRASKLPNWRVATVLALFVVIMGIDGVNSYFTLFPNFQGVYRPHNTLRLITGIFCGLSLINLVFPMFNQSLWIDSEVQEPAIRNLKELAGLSLIAALVAALVIVQNSTLLLVLGLISAAGVVIVLTMIMTVGFVTTLGHFQEYRSWKELYIPLIAGLTLTIIMIGGIDFLRYSLTGTWEGFQF